MPRFSCGDISCELFFRGESLPRGMVSIMFGIGIWELLIVLGIVVLIFGTRLPSIARAMGKSITEFKHGMHEDDATQDRVEHK